MTDTKTAATAVLNDADRFRAIPLGFYFQDFESLNQYHNVGRAPYMRPTFHGVRLTLGIYDTENLLDDLAKAVGMPKPEAAEIISKFRVYTQRFEGPETPPEF